ncbi:MAG: class II aldolase/adducin family protein [Synergistaceae bacterium]|jgi:ribulose-5-phosphate 4-epimerase/fuculose-1-phosphate aldolase|nr:class II aldolase/adducin family protein [Synergistaceae bacterium]
MTGDWAAGDLRTGDSAAKLTAEAIRIASSLFARGKTSGASGNLSFVHDGSVYVSASGSCFGTLREEDFSRVSMDGTLLSGRKPSRELPLHLSLYRRHKNAAAVLHTHSPYSTLWSCLEPGSLGPGSAEDVLPDYTPYLRMRVGRVALVPYAPPGSPELFALFDGRASDGVRCYLLAHHGSIIAGESLSSVFFDLEELEDSARIAYSLALLGAGGSPLGDESPNQVKFHTL